MESLTPRQAQILKVLIEEYIEDPEPVGSETLEKKHNLGVSPATIRNEMATLTSTGYLKQPHTSSGRIPTSKALRFYVQQLMEEKKLSVAEEVKSRQRVEDARENVDHLMREVTRALAQETKALSVGAIEGQDALWHSGYKNILDCPEFYNIDVTSHVLSFLEEANRVQELLFETAYGEPVGIIFGEDLGWPFFEPVSVVTTRFHFGNGVGSIGVIGPARLPFSYIIPKVRYFGTILSDIAKNINV